MNEQKDISELKANPKNPRTISKHDFDALVVGMKEFGDLSGVVLNVTTGQLVGGHQRVQAFKKLGGQPVIEERLTMQNSVGTIARGYVLLGDEKFSYREVQWELPRETAANIAANRIQGEFNLDMLAELNYELKAFDPELLEKTGQTLEEQNSLLEMVGGNGDTNQERSLVIRIECDSDEQLNNLFLEFKERGLNVRI